MPPRAAEASGWLLEARPFERMGVRFMERRWFRALLHGLERAILPGLLLHYALRKRSLEQVARRSLDEGFARVVVLGAGFDTLALRLHEERPDVTFVEVDHPATQSVKREALARRGLPRDNLRLVPADLARDSLGGILGGDGHGKPPDTLVIAEGLLMYLGPEEVEALFRSLREAACARLRVAFTFMEADESGRGRFKGARPLVDLWLRRRGEPFRWALRPAEARAFVDSFGFRLEDLVRAEDLRGRYLGDGAVALARGEAIAVSRRPR